MADAQRSTVEALKLARRQSIISVPPTRASASSSSVSTPLLAKPTWSGLLSRTAEVFGNVEAVSALLICGWFTGRVIQRTRAWVHKREHAHRHASGQSNQLLNGKDAGQANSGTASAKPEDGSRAYRAEDQEMELSWMSATSRFHEMDTGNELSREEGEPTWVSTREACSPSPLSSSRRRQHTSSVSKRSANNGVSFATAAEEEPSRIESRLHFGAPPCEFIAVRLMPGMEVRTALDDLVKARNLKAASIVSAVGSLTDTELRLPQAVAFNPGKPHIAKGPHELVSLSGTLSPSGAHVHASVSDRQGVVWGGHLSKGFVHTTIELVILDLSPQYSFHRTMDPGTGYPELVVGSPV